MGYQKIMNLLDNTTNRRPKFRTRNWVEIKYESRGTCNYNSEIRFKTSMISQTSVTIVMHTYMLKQL